MHIVIYNYFQGISYGTIIKGFSTKKEAKAFNNFLNEAEKRKFIDKTNVKICRI